MSDKPRHIMEPDPDAPDIDPMAALWLIVVVLAFVLLVMGVSR